MSSTPVVPVPDETADENPAGQPKKKRSLLRRILMIIGIIALVLVLILAGIIAYLWWRVPSDKLAPMVPGTVEVRTTASPLTVGPFTVSVNADRNSGITVTQGVGGPVVWRTHPGRAFIAAGIGKVTFKEHFGYFWADVNRSAQLTEQTVDKVTQQGANVLVKGQVSGSDHTAEYSLTLRPIVKAPGTTTLGLDVTVTGNDGGQPITSVLLTSGRDDDEQIHGLGEPYRALDLSGDLIPLLPREQGLGRGQQPLTFVTDVAQWAGGNLTTTYAAWPAYLTSANRALTFADTEASGSFAIADFRRTGEISLESWTNTLSAEALVGGNPAAAIRARAAGQQRPQLADWVQHGAVLGLQGGTAKVRAEVAEMQAAGTKLSGVWLQDWTGKRVTSFGDRLWWTWQLDQTRYPGWDVMVADFNSQGIKVLTYINPWLVEPPTGGPPVKNLYAEAEQRGYLVRNTAGQPYSMDQNGFEATLVDFTNPAARDWYANIIATYVLGVGADGFMADFGEALPFDGVLFAGKPLQQHNRYPELWAQTVKEGCKRAGKPDCVAFMRSGFLTSNQDVPLMWAGDQMVDYSDQDGLASAVMGMLDTGISGTPLNHSDIGGYTSVNVYLKNYIRPPNLNARWAEMQAFGVMMRTHEGNRPAENQQVYSTPETRSAFARSTQIYSALYRYRKTVIDEAVATGVPAMRHTWLVYPNSRAAAANLQFFLGEHLLMAPVTSERATSVKVSFPPGTWVHALTGQTFGGDTETEVAAPIGTPAAFVKQGDPAGEQIRADLKSAGLTTD